MIKIAAKVLFLVEELVLLMIPIQDRSAPLVVTLLPAAAVEVLKALGHYPVVRWCHHLRGPVGGILIEVTQHKAAEVGREPAVKVVEPCCRGSRWPEWRVLQLLPPHLLQLAWPWL